MRTTKLTSIKKCRIVEEAERTGKIRETARNHNVHPWQIRRWDKNYTEIKAMAEHSPKKLTVHQGSTSVNKAVEDQVYDWVLAQRTIGNCVTTKNIADYAVSISSSFKDGVESKISRWVYDFLQRHNLCIRTRTRIAQVTDSVMLAVKKDFCFRVMQSYKYRINNPRYLVNMDQTAVFLNCSPTRTVDIKGKRTVSIRVGGSGSMKFTLCVAVALDGTKLPLFVIFKGQPNGSIARSLPSILPDGIYGCVQEKGWCDERAMNIWYTNIWKQHIAGHNGESGLILDDYQVHKTDSLLQRMTSDLTTRYLIPGGYTAVLQPCDVGVNKPLKQRLKQCTADWRREKFGGLSVSQKLPSPKREDVVLWLQNLWTNFETEIVQNSFRGSGYFFEDGVDYGMETENESDNE